MGNHSSGCEEWFFEVLEIHGDDRFVQEVAVGALYRFSEFRNRFAGHVKIANLLKGHESVRLDRDFLIQFGTKLKAEVQNVARAQFVSRVPF